MNKIEYGCRWEEAVQKALDMLGGGKEVLRVDYISDYQGYLDIDVLLNDGRVFSYMYEYGSCSGCDPWEGTEFDFDKNSGHPKLACFILDEATIFDDMTQYVAWRSSITNWNVQNEEV